MSTQATEPSSYTASDLIRLAAQQPPEPIIEGTMNVGDILLLHGTEECFKSVFVVQMAESIALATPLLRFWNVPRPRKVGIIETEMHPAMLGVRLTGMFPDGNPPGNMLFFHESQLRKWRRKSMAKKFEMIQQWIRWEGIEVLIIDTANDFFRGKDSPSDEPVAGGFFDQLRNLEVQARVIVRHDRKRREGDLWGGGSSNEQIRGSAEFKEDPEVILNLERQDRRTNEVHLEVGKLRYGSKPEPMILWFDAGCFRLTPLPPVISVLETGPQSRQVIIDQCKRRFAIGERKADEMLAEAKPFLRESQRGHQKAYEIDWERAAEAPWQQFLVVPAVGCVVE